MCVADLQECGTKKYVPCLGHLAQWKTIRFVISSSSSDHGSNPACSRIFSRERVLIFTNLRLPVFEKCGPVSQPRKSEFGNAVIDHPTSERKGICRPEQISPMTHVLRKWTHAICHNNLLRNSTTKTNSTTNSATHRSTSSTA